jgi:hypothetical protein
MAGGEPGEWRGAHPREAAFRDNWIASRIVNQVAKQSKCSRYYTLLLCLTIKEGEHSEWRCDLPSSIEAPMSMSMAAIRVIFRSAVWVAGTIC